MTKDQALKKIDESDKTRAAYINKLFNTNIDDSSKYDLVINSAYMDVEDLLEVVSTAIMCKFNKLKHLNHEII